MPFVCRMAFDSGEVSTCQLLLARLAQTGADLIEIGIVVAGMANELPCAFGKILRDTRKVTLIKYAGHQHSDSSHPECEAHVSQLRVENRQQTCAKRPYSLRDSTVLALGEAVRWAAVATC